MNFRGNRRQNNGMGLGSGGTCVCPICHTTIPHRQGSPCYQEVCPNCGAKMSRSTGSGQTSNYSSSSTSTRRIAKIDIDTCIGCRKCISACPFGAIEMVNGKAHIIADKCRGCMVCTSSCPVQAIS